MSLLDHVTPVVITWNEEPNIKRVFDQLGWARDIVVVDSGSSDGTLPLLTGYPNVRVFGHAFRSHAEQWNFALRNTGITTEWVLSMDADFVLSDALVAELRHFDPAPGLAGCSVRFVYWALGRPLRGCLVPPRVVFFRIAQGDYEQEGHTQRLRLRGPVHALASPIFHDDRKPLSRWVASQERYATLEAQRLVSAPSAELDWADRIRRTASVAPALVAIYCLLMKGCILDGRAGLHYTFQRVIAECLVAMRIWEMRMRGD
jgi:glycosyltransferase involved in cell wall biosynthesis